MRPEPEPCLLGQRQSSFGRLKIGMKRANRINKTTAPIQSVRTASMIVLSVSIVPMISMPNASAKGYKTFSVLPDFSPNPSVRKTITPKISFSASKEAMRELPAETVSMARAIAPL